VNPPCRPKGQGWKPSTYGWRACVLSRSLQACHDVQANSTGGVQEGSGGVRTIDYQVVGKAVAQKNGKTEFLFNPPEPQTCVTALFPRAGYVPCWYLQRHTSSAPISNRNYANHCLFNQLQGHQAPHSSHLIK